MKEVIKEYIEFTDDEKKELWDTAVFVFDTNVLLNLYRYTNKTREAMFSAMDSLKDRIWMPYQIAFEFMKDRAEIIIETVNGYDDLTKEKDKFLKTCSDRLRINKNEKTYKNLDKYIDKWIKNNKEDNLLVVNPSNDIILDKVLELYDSKTGEPYDTSTLEAIAEEGKIRYEHELPPGYKDNDKRNNNEYGDLIIWKQILSYSKNNNKDIIFVTNDKKEDWWNIAKGKTIGPRPELRKEFYKETSKRFHMYTMETFLAQYRNSKGEPVDDTIMQEIIESSFVDVDDDSFKNVQLIHNYETGDYIIEYLDKNGRVTSSRSVKADIDNAKKSLQERIKNTKAKVDDLDNNRSILTDEEFHHKRMFLLNEVNEIENDFNRLTDYLSAFMPAV